MSIIHITPQAQARIRQLLDNAPPEICAISITLSKGGCTGLVYKVDYTKSIASDAEVIEGKFGKVVIASSAILYLLGAKMDFEDNDLHSRFVFYNPNESSRCGCGLSITF